MKNLKKLSLYFSKNSVYYTLRKSLQRRSFMSDGIFVVVDGTDGSGKSSVIELLTQYLEKRGYPIFLTDSARDSFELTVRNIIRKTEDIDPWTLEMLFVAIRVNLRHVIQQALDQRKVVIADRYVYSAIAFGVYDICNRLPKSDPDDVRSKLIRFYEQLPLPKPDVGMILSVPGHIAYERICTAKRDSMPLISRFEKEEAIDRIHQEFKLLSVGGHFPEMHLVDNTGELSATFEKVQSIVEQKLSQSS